jgi:hypothetical protein
VSGHWVLISKPEALHPVTACLTNVEHSRRSVEHSNLLTRKRIGVRKIIPVQQSFMFHYR